ncbi:hypothetical protein FOL47_001684 [Perkinsus chesapeaki]|uniref:Uncharacterized protein n=1 Tax=Perkinsus chesapeaki TaxID=330153 RepID=A0A7J6MHY4_PERCH|nr:hypothetical protein FOL47_001684 [Perkinsus chesapeaki]
MHIIHTILLSNLPLITALRSLKPDDRQVAQWLKRGLRIDAYPEDKLCMILPNSQSSDTSISLNVEEGEDTATVTIAKLECDSENTNDDDDALTYVIKNGEVNIDGETFNDPLHDMVIRPSSNFEQMCERASLAFTVVVGATARSLFKKVGSLLSYVLKGAMRYVYDYNRDEPLTGMWFKRDQQGRLETERVTCPKGYISHEYDIVINSYDNGTIVAVDMHGYTTKAEDPIYNLNVSPASGTGDVSATIQQQLLYGMSKGSKKLPETCDEILKALCSVYKQALPPSELPLHGQHPLDFYTSVPRVTTVQLL